MKCQVEACPRDATDVLTYKREGGQGGATGAAVVFEVAFCDSHAAGLRALASAFVNDPQAQPKIAVACGSQGCMEVASVKLTDATGKVAGLYCPIHAEQALAALNGTMCSLDGCEKPGRLVVEGPLGTEAIYGCVDHAPALEEAARAAGAVEVTGAKHESRVQEEGTPPSAEAPQGQPAPERDVRGEGATEPRG